MSDKLDKAEDLLKEAYDTLVQRGKLHDKAGEEERSLGKVAEMMSILKGRPFTGEDIGLVQICVKLVRSQQGNYHHDNFVDLAGYAALTGEEAHSAHLQEQSLKTKAVCNGSSSKPTLLVPKVPPKGLIPFLKDKIADMPLYDHVALALTEGEEGDEKQLTITINTPVTVGLSVRLIRQYLEENSSPSAYPLLPRIALCLSSIHGVAKQYSVIVDPDALLSTGTPQAFLSLVTLIADYLNANCRPPSAEVGDKTYSVGSSATAPLFTGF